MKEKRVALITEAGNGLAQTFASILKSKGFDIIVVAKGKSYRELLDLNLEDIKLLELDLTQHQDVVKLYSYIKTGYGKLDTLVNNAEIANGFGQKINEINLNEVRALYEENFFSVITTIKTLYPLLLKSDNPSIINISSALGDVNKMKDEGFCYSDYNMLGYATAKSALEMLTVLLKKEFQATQIKISSFDPVRPKNSTHNTVTLCEGVKSEFLEHIN